jgi:hypothetical protein
MMKFTKGLCAAAVLLAAMTIGVTAQQAAAPTTPADKVVISGWALNFSNTATGANQTIQITIDKWSTPAERDRLIEVFMAKKQDGLVDALNDLPEKGRFNFPGYMGPDPNNTMRLGTEIRYAMSTALPDGGRRIVVMTPRIMGFQELRNQPRTVDYPFTLFQMQFDKSGKGEGRMAYGTKIEFDKKKQVIDLENYSSEPVRLNQLQLKTK